MDTYKNANLCEEPIMIDLPPMPAEEDYIVCYMDVLGAKDLIEKGLLFETLYHSFSFARNVFAKIGRFNALEIKAFSDNLIIAQKIPADENGWRLAYKNLVLFLKIFLHQFLSSGILVRGGITLGKLAINDIMVWGRGLVDAVTLEEKVAIYPRIVVSSALAELMNAYPLAPNRFFEEEFSCLTDIDGSLFIDYINYGELPDAEKALKTSHRLTLEKLAAESNPRVQQKLHWHLTYLERAKDIFNEHYGDFAPLVWSLADEINS